MPEPDVNRGYDGASVPVGNPLEPAVATAELQPSWPMGLRVTCGAAPLQIEGPIDGGYVYFRARHGSWQIAIGRTADEAVDATIDRPGAPVEFSGECQHGHANRAEARAILNEYLPKLRLR